MHSLPGNSFNKHSLDIWWKQAELYPAWSKEQSRVTNPMNLIFSEENVWPISKQTKCKAMSVVSAEETGVDRKELAADRYMILERESGKARWQMNKKWKEVKEHSHVSTPGKNTVSPLCLQVSHLVSYPPVKSIWGKMWVYLTCKFFSLSLFTGQCDIQIFPQPLDCIGYYK